MLITWKHTRNKTKETENDEVWDTINGIFHPDVHFDKWTHTHTQTPTATCLCSASFVSVSDWTGTPCGGDEMNNSMNTRRFLTWVQSTSADRPPTARRRLLLPLFLCFLSVCVSPPSLATFPPLCLCVQPRSLSLSLWLHTSHISVKRLEARLKYETPVSYQLQP